VRDGADAAARATVLAMDTHPTQLTIAAQGPLDEQGRLLHEDDAAAQLALALANVAGVLRAADLGWPDVADLRVCTTDLAELLDVYDTLTEHLATVGATPETSVVEVSRLPVPGMTVCIDGHAVRRTPQLSETDNTEGMS
jgi:enamine deaminase RidA (YjgF/YER057c/UK114 family)